jgi:YfiH family protein
MSNNYITSMSNNYITSKRFNNHNLSFGFFTRQGGSSLKNLSSLNCSYNNGDHEIFVKNNIMQAQKELFLDKKKIKFLNQIHSNKTIIINQNNYSDRFEADGMITQDKNICIAILTADCCPIFLFDDENSFISCLHAGWKGVYYNIIKNALDQIIKIQPNLNKVRAIIGPCLNVDNFEISEDFKEKFIKVNPNYKNYFIQNLETNKKFFNMRSLIKLQLMESEVKNIDNINIDTYDNESLFYSHRRSTHLNQLPTGRMINIIGFNT